MNKPSNIVLDPTARQGGAVWIEALPRAAGHHALSAYAVQLTRLERRESVKDCRNERFEVGHTVGRRTQKEHTDGCGG